MVCTTSLEQRLVDTSAASNNTNCRTATSRNSLLSTRGKTNTGLVLIGRVTNYSGVVTGCPSQCATVANLLLDIADNGTLGTLSNGEDIANGERSLLAGIDESTSVKTLGRDEGLLAELVTVWVAENDTGKRSTTDPGLACTIGILE